MIRRLGLSGAIVAAAVVAAACADDDPTGVGVELVHGVELRTFEVVLDGDRVFESGATFSGYQEPWQTSRVVAANDAGGRLDVRALARFGGLPSTISWEDSTGPRSDSEPSFFGGELRVPVDTTVMRELDPIDLRLLPVIEAWHDRSATWTTRIDTGQVTLPWSEPGGTTGEPVATASWSDSQDTLVFAVDSQTVAAWTDTDEDARGAMIAVETPGARFFGRAMVLRLHARPSTDPDTVVDVDISPRASTFIFDPRPSDAQEVRVGGNPGWRSFLRFRDRLDTITVATPDGENTYQLADLAINAATLSLTPLAPPAGFEPEDTVWVGVRVAHTSDEIPLARSPIGRPLTREVTGAPVPRDRFTTALGEPVDVDVSQFALVSDLVATQGGETVPRTIAILPSFANFGIATFGAPGGGDAAPRLRLVVTVAEEDDIE
ncbi:MAG: hypothetical protein ACOC8B_05275 [Gemmatimonadota bacterium]